MKYNNYYPQLLVTLQFGIIGVMVLLSKGFFSNLIAIFIFIVGALLGIWALNHNRLGNFNIQPRMRENAKLITTGIYGYIRHPMYLSVIIMMLAFAICSPTIIEIILLIGLIIVLVLKAKREEKLWLNHSEAYEKYKEQTKLFIPYIL
jgi:protein-S-isoprenylcysteine O-methyltransferase Ste14